MAYSTEQTIWPASAITEEIKALIARFFSLMDDPSEEVGDVLADEIFTSNGTLAAAAGTAVGSSEIRKCREHAWNVIKTRRHLVQKVYTHGQDCSDLMLIGTADMGLSDGRTVAMEFTARLVVAGDSASGPRLQSYQVWADSAPLTNALQVR